MRNKNGIYLEGLNGIRAIAAIAVVVSHITLHLANFNLNPYIFGKAYDGNPKGIILAGYGVSMFFALSGFLITYLLLLEKEEKSKINIRFFYIRRILRIWPVYYSFLIICLPVMYFSGISIKQATVVLYILYAPNVPYILNTSLPLLSHYWSLGVEEQFYLFWPWVVRVKKNLHWIIFCGIISLISLKLVVRYFSPGRDHSILYQAIHVTRFHCMMIGAMGAVLFVQKNPLFIKICTNKISQLVAWGIIIATAINQFHLASVLDSEIISVITVIIILGQATKTNKLINLERKVPDFVGKISYGIYVYHPLVIWAGSFVLANIAVTGILKYLLVYVTIIATTLGIAYFSYTYFEKWFLKLKLNYTIINSSEQ